MTRDEVKRVIGYVRVSTSDQGRSGLGLEAQVEAINAKARSKGWEVLRIAQDVASGRSLNGRPAMKAALEDLRARRADALVVSKLDRLSRSLIDFAQMLETARKQGWHVVMLDLELDTSTPMGKLSANMLANVAQYEREMIGLRTKEALAVKRSRGERLGRERVITPAVERRIRQLRDKKGLSYQAIAAALDEAGVPSPAGGERWNWSTIRRVMERAGT